MAKKRTRSKAELGAIRRYYAEKKKAGGQSSPGKKQHKWNRVRIWSRKKPTKSTKGHPAYIFERSGRLMRHLLFTHSPTTDGEENVLLKHNIDPDEVDRDSYVRPKAFVSQDGDFEPVDKKYRIHKEDQETIKQIKQKKDG